MGFGTPTVSASLEEFATRAIIPELNRRSPVYVKINLSGEKQEIPGQCRVGVKYFFLATNIFSEFKNYATYEEAISQGLIDAKDSLLSYLPANVEFAPNPLPVGRNYTQLRLSLKK